MNRFRSVTLGSVAAIVSMAALVVVTPSVGEWALRTRFERSTGEARWALARRLATCSSRTRAIALRWCLDQAASRRDSALSRSAVSVFSEVGASAVPWLVDEAATRSGLSDHERVRSSAPLPESSGELLARLIVICTGGDSQWGDPSAPDGSSIRYHAGMLLVRAPEQRLARIEELLGSLRYGAFGAVHAAFEAIGEDAERELERIARNPTSSDFATTFARFVLECRRE